MSLSIIISR